MREWICRGLDAGGQRESIGGQRRQAAVKQRRGLNLSSFHVALQEQSTMHRAGASPGCAVPAGGGVQLPRAGRPAGSWPAPPRWGGGTRSCGPAALQARGRRGVGKQHVQGAGQLEKGGCRAALTPLVACSSRVLQHGAWGCVRQGAATPPPAALCRAPWRVGAAVCLLRSSAAGIGPPERMSAGSRMSGRLVAAMILICSRAR